MEAKDYVSYIAYFWKNYTLSVPKSEFLSFLNTKLGSKMFEAPLPKLRETARFLYKGYVVSMYTRYTPFYIVSKLEYLDIDKYLDEIIELNKKYDLFYITIDYDLTNSSMDSNIKKIYMSNYKSVLAELEDVSPKKVKTGTKTGKKLSEKDSSKKPKAVSKNPKVGKPGKNSSKKPKSVTAKSTSGKQRSSAKKVSYKKCSDYKVGELRGMAKGLKIPGYSKMAKNELCKTLKIK